ncbi:hypothetical protein SmJEL517_g00147 [Synchytrium microbalum]|uniref:C2 domain-containing protein n=1 Tax=Synchytrium microbalum TaxID=1806994 RepID=A0A507CIT1_9FUNG|nr:uncharacterized protein SmJEL517_g00147 [Synchytrium microbalum]TPX38146.1 hypothetical protein SmJEL517_g00147 [Synchytrium microbalum]
MAAGSATPSRLHTLLVTVYEGRNFTRKPNAKCYIQCRFNNEILTTDPTDHGPSPIWDTELEWDMDMRTLSHHRSQRNSLKLICYSIDTSGNRDNLGFVMLELRAAHQGFPAPEQWHLLINTKTPSGAFKPEIKVSFGVGPKAVIVQPSRIIQQSATVADTSTNVENNSKHKKPPVTKSTDGTAVDGHVGSLSFHLMEGGYYQIGEGTTRWTLSLTIAFVEHLNVLLDHAAPAESKFYFYYSVMGNDIATEPFSDLSAPSFPYERVTMHLSCTLPDLVKLLEEMGVIVVNLCGDNQILGFADVPLTGLLDDDTGEGRLIERVYNLYNPKLELPMNAEGKIPSIGLAINLERDSGNSKHTVVVGAPTKEASGIESKEPMSAPAQQQNETPMRQQTVSPPPEVVVQQQQPIAEIVRPPSPPVPALLHKMQRVTQSSPTRTLPSANLPSLYHNMNPAPSSNLVDTWNQYRFSIEVRSIRDFTLKSASIFCRYSYTPFGTSAPFATHPRLDLLKSPAEVLLPHSFCAYEFVMAPNRLQTYLEAVPLVVEMWSKDPYARDVLIGTASVDMAEVWQAHPRRHDGEVGGVVSVKSFDSWQVVVGTDEDGQVKRISDLRVILALEDFGPLEQQESGAPQSMPYSDMLQQQQQSIPTPRARPPPAQPSTNQPPDVSINSSIHETAEYRAALDLEVWRMEEERDFRNHLLAREQDLMRQLAEEWKKHERERDALLQRRSEDLKQLESQAQKMIADLETRERRLLTAEEDLSKRRDDIEREHERFVGEVRDASRRLGDELNHRLEVEKERAAHSEAGRERAIRERDELESRYKELESSERALRPALSAGPDAQLKSELVTAVAGVTNLQRQVDNLTRAKKHYKANWMRALNELAKERKDKQTELEERVQRTEEGRAKEREREVLERDRRDIEAVRKEVENLRASIGPNAIHNVASAAEVAEKQQDFVISKRDYDALDSRRLEEVDRLASERDQLLASGVYTREDRLVRELERRIREVLAGQ